MKALKKDRLWLGSRSSSELRFSVSRVERAERLAAVGSGIMEDSNFLYTFLYFYIFQNKHV